MMGESIAGVAIFCIVAIILLFGWLTSEYTKGSVRAQESVPTESVPDVSTKEENVSEELPEPPPMRQGNGERVPLQKRVQPIKHKPTTSTGRSDTAYGHPVVDTFDYHEPVRSSSSGGYNGCSGSSSSSSDSSSNFD